MYSIEAVALLQGLALVVLIEELLLYTDFFKFAEIYFVPVLELQIFAAD